MAKLKKINLPRKYEYKEGESRPEYEKYKGWNKISYSQYNSFMDDLYRGDYFGGYFLGVRRDSGIFAMYGSDCGDYLNIYDDRACTLLSENDRKTLDNVIKEHPKNAEFEYEILIDLEPFGLKHCVLQGFTDRQFLTESEVIEVTDYKTLNMEKKKKYYSSSEYKQLNIYGYGLEELGFKVGDTYVTGLGRKGNSLDSGAKYPMRLSGVVERIDNPYNREEATKDIKAIVKGCIEIDKYYKVYKKIFC